MNIFITQDSYYFVHKYFINIFEANNVELIFVRENKRGILKKYKELISEFGFLNFVKVCVLELKYFLKLCIRKNKLNFQYVSDSKLNKVLESKLMSNKFSGVISIGCPCKIDTLIQKKFNVDIFNVHGGIIPFQKGRFSPIKAYKKKHKYIGATIHKITDSFDKGQIISQDFIKVLSDDKIIDYYSKVLNLSSLLVKEFLIGNRKKINYFVENYFNELVGNNNEK